MALLHQADIRPSKLDLLGAWLPGRSWFAGSPSDPVVRVGSCHFDDPAGAVGVETFVLRAGDGPLLHVPLTYRDAPLDGGERHLLGTTEHSVLGRRWVYDGCGDPVYAATLAHAILTGGVEAQEYFDIDGHRQFREPDLTVRGDGAAAVSRTPVVERVDDGDPTVMSTDRGELVVIRTPGASNPVDGSGTLTGVWTDGTGVLAYARGF